MSRGVSTCVGEASSGTASALHFLPVCGKSFSERCSARPNTQPFSFTRSCASAGNRRFARHPPSGSPARDRMRMIASLDHGLVTKGALGEAGIDERDPFADRRLIEFSLRLPPDQFLKDGIFRPLARSALSDRLPAEILDARLRGLQAADWPARFPQSEASRILDAVEDCSNVAELLDIPALRAAVSDWPETDRDVLAKWELYSRVLPAALATAVFIKTFSDQLQSRPGQDQLSQYGGA